jgi:hypothetical protein
MKRIIILGSKSGFIVSCGDIVLFGENLTELVKKVEEKGMGKEKAPSEKPEA